jgi:hypothetical protein
MGQRSYHYVGPEAVRIAAASSPAGSPICARAQLDAWLAEHAADRDRGLVPATFVVTDDGVLRIASRRSEHVACAGGGDVLAAGEMFFSTAAEARLVAVSNLSTGYCPESTSWPAVAAALERAGVAHPGAYTSAFDFRRCPACGERNLVKDSYFVCAICDAELPAIWNF